MFKLQNQFKIISIYLFFGIIFNK
ncbi:SVM family protein [Candidatus Phytoplasma rubi]